jgi:F0F1-type ATP synthase epsilon subunit
MDAIQKAARAKALIDDPLLKGAFDVLENEQISIFTDQACDAEQIMEAHRMVRALRRLRDELTSVITDGKLLERQIEKGQHRV